MPRIFAIIFALVITIPCVCSDNILYRYYALFLSFMAGALTLTVIIDLRDGSPLD